MNDSSAGTWKRRAREERGQTLVEYALIIAVVSLGSLVALGFLSGKIQALFSKAGNSIENVTVASGGSGSGGSGGGTPPPVPTLTGGPAEGTSGNSATYTNPSFSFTSAGATGFQCSIDGGTFGNCTSPTSMGPGLGTGAHSFAVQASSAGGTSAPATRSWTVTAAAAVPSGGSASVSCSASPCEDDNTLTGSTSGWNNNGSAIVSYTYQWQDANDGMGNSCPATGYSNVGSSTTIAGTSTTFNPPDVNDDRCYRVVVLATNGVGPSSTVASSPFYVGED